MSTYSESYETGGRVNNGGGFDANDRRIAQIEKAFGSAGQVKIESLIQRNVLYFFTERCQRLRERGFNSRNL